MADRAADPPSDRPTHRATGEALRLRSPIRLGEKGCLFEIGGADKRAAPMLGSGDSGDGGDGGDGSDGGDGDDDDGDDGDDDDDEEMDGWMMMMKGWMDGWMDG